MKTRQFTFAVSTLILVALCARARGADTLTVVPDETTIANTGPKSFLSQSLQVELKFDVSNASRLSDIEAVRVVPTRATDDTGLSLLDPERYEAEWRELFGFGDLKAELDSPARGAKALRELSGFVELYRLKDDPASVITIPNISQLAPQTLDNPVLKAANIQITLITYGELDRYRKSLSDPKIAYPAASEQILKREIGSSLPYFVENIKSQNKANFALYIKDPEHRLVEKEIQLPDDEKVSFSNSSSKDRTIFDFNDSPPPNFGLKLSIATPKSTTKIPFNFTGLALPARAPSLPVAATNIHDDRQSASSFTPGSLDVKLKIALPEVARARDIRVAVNSATDATGKPLFKAELFKSKWGEISATDNRQTTSAEITLDSPARSAPTLREVAGTIELYDPARDPRSVITVTDITAQAGQILTDPTLKALGVEVAFLNQAQLERATEIELDRPATAENPNLTPKIKAVLFEAIKELFGVLTVDEKTLAFRISDPNARLVDVAVETADGKILKRTGRSSSGALQTYKFEDKIPPDAHLKIYVATPQSVTTVPFKLSDVPLP